ncbi:MAG: MMPL family transporter [Bacteroidales bacterium]|nr:MMPL family transporter [Bacteroidales bacterium]
MWSLLIASTLVFAWFGVKLRYEEDIMKLLPQTEESTELAFGEIDLKEKIFVQVTSADTLNPVSPAILGDAVEKFCHMLEERDSATRYISGILASLDVETGLNAMEYGLEHLPSFVDTSWYALMEKALTPDAIQAQMMENAHLIMEDETGDDTQLVSMDPLNLRSILLHDILGEGSALGSFNMVDGHFFCLDKSVALAFVAPSFISTDTGKGTRLVKMINNARKDFEKSHPDLRVLVHGNPQGSVSNAGTIKRDLVWTVGLSLLLILLIMMFSFHKLSFIVHQIVPVIYGALFSMACMYLIKGYMSLMALGLGAVILGVAISYCLHVLIHFYYVGDVEKMLRDESTPVVLGCITTVGAFLGLLFTDSDLLSDFGLFATFALLGNTFFVLVFLPHFLNPSQIKFKRTHGFPLVERINSLPWDRNKWVIGTLVVAIIVGIAFSGKVKFDYDLRNLDYDDPDLVESQNLYNRKNADGSMHMYFAAWDDNSIDAALEYNKALFPVLDSLQEEGVVTSYSPVTKFLFQSREDQRERIQAWNGFWNKSRVARLKRDLGAAAAANNLPYNLFDPFLDIISRHYEPDNLFESGVAPAGLLSNYAEKQGSGRYMVFTDVSYPLEKQEDVFESLTRIPHIFVLEPFYYCQDLVKVIHEDFSTTLWISSIFVLIVLLLSFRNLWIALVAFFPMFVSWYVMQGYMAIFGLEFNLINIVIATFVYGIGVDYSIFVMEGLLAEARRGEKSMLEYHKVAIFYSALVLGIVIFSLVFATHPSIHSIGIITLIGMASTILITYSLQPWIFRMLVKIPFFKKTFRIPE